GRGQPPQLTFGAAHRGDWPPPAPVDVIVSNAVLQWVPGHLDLLPRWVSWLAPGGWLAFEIPGNVGAPQHAAIEEMAASPRWRPLLGQGGYTRQTGDLVPYLDVLAAADCAVDAWET